MNNRYSSSRHSSNTFVSGCFVGQAVDEFDKPVVRTKQSHPYSYDGFVTYRNGKNEEATGTIYSDRLLQWDYAKARNLMMKHFSESGDYWDSRSPEKIQSFLQDWTDERNLKLILVMEYCNVSNGYPVWRFDYAVSKQPLTMGLIASSISSENSNPLLPKDIDITPKEPPIPKGCERYYYNRDGICPKSQSLIYFDAMKPRTAREKWERWLNNTK